MQWWCIRSRWANPRRSNGNKFWRDKMDREALREKIQEIVARECSHYTESPVPKERCVGAATQILWLLEGYEVKQK
jgi:hypothetical protein